ncbi:hypothetical protein BC834DRAFT_505501 [Gloeopeniophorella convolvens]|nr:hypothetical protein BC834DRAFT_505501 [Gloeopeniophorella convolvens]
MQDTSYFLSSPPRPPQPKDDSDDSDTASWKSTPPAGLEELMRTVAARRHSVSRRLEAAQGTSFHVSSTQSGLLRQTWNPPASADHDGEVPTYRARRSHRPSTMANRVADPLPDNFVFKEPKAIGKVSNVVDARVEKKKKVYDWQTKVTGDAVRLSHRKLSKEPLDEDHLPCLVPRSDADIGTLEIEDQSKLVVPSSQSQERYLSMPQLSQEAPVDFFDGSGTLIDGAYDEDAAASGLPSKYPSSLEGSPLDSRDTRTETTAARHGRTRNAATTPSQRPPLLGMRRYSTAGVGKYQKTTHSIDSLE